jgi:alcohol dehydrogenase class IV
MRFDFSTATRILFGPGVVKEVAPAAKQMGGRALLVTGRSPGRSAPLFAQLEAAGITCSRFAVEGEPTTDLIAQGTEQARRERCDLVIALGGGSVIDTGKAIAALLTNSGDLMDYLEVIGKAMPLSHPSAPLVAVPTTAGTGTEVTRNAVLGSHTHRVKVSLRSPWMLPKLAVVDPELTFDLPPTVTARTGLDALTQLIEPYVSIRANPMTDMFCKEGMLRVSRSLRRAYREGSNAEARADMSLAALLSGLALANAGLGVVHGFAGPFGGMFPAPHGAVCAALLPHGMDVNIRAMRARPAENQALQRYETVAQILTGRPNASAEEGVEWVRTLCHELKIPPLGTYGAAEQDVPLLVEKASKANSMRGNPVSLTLEELQEIISRAIA